MFQAGPNVAFFGATGGCTIAVLAAALEAGFRARALVRSPQKLTDLLTKRELPNDIIVGRLMVVQGNAKDPEAVRKTLVDESGVGAEQIVFRTGGVPKFTPNPLKPTLDDPTVCQTSISVIFSTLKDLYSDNRSGGLDRPRPLLTAVSTTGISSKRDLPIAMIPLYHWLLAALHADKKVMERLIEKAQADAVIKGYIIVGPSLLIDGRRQGLSKVKIGWENEDPAGKGAAVGYGVSREDVGGFIFEEVVAKMGGNYIGKKVTIAY